MSVLIIIQARLGSTRLPGKILLPLGGKPVLQHVVERAQRAGYPVVVACPGEDMEAIERAVPCWPAPPGTYRKGVSGHRGYDTDVLKRYAVTVEGFTPFRPSVVVRLTADCPCLDPRLIRRAVEAVQAGHDYAGNTVERHWPRGLDVECFTTELLMRAHELATDPYDREHVTPWMQRWASNPYPLPKTHEDALGLTSSYRWTLDSPEDYSWLTEAFRRFPDATPEQLLTLPPRYD